MHKGRRCFNIFGARVGFIFDHIIGPKKDNHFCPLFVFHRGMSNAICDPVIHLQSEELKFHYIPAQSIKALKNGICNTVFCSAASWMSVYFCTLRWMGTRSRK